MSEQQVYMGTTRTFEHMLAKRSRNFTVLEVTGPNFQLHTRVGGKTTVYLKIAISEVGAYAKFGKFLSGASANCDRYSECRVGAFQTQTIHIFIHVNWFTIYIDK